MVRLRRSDSAFFVIVNFVVKFYVKLDNLIMREWVCVKRNNLIL